VLRPSTKAQTMQKIFSQRTSRGRSEKGAALIEYALLAALIAVIGVGTIQKVGESVKGKATKINLAVGAGAIDQCDPDVDPDC
jgi:Flp pilus assembly pilin Flp